MAIANGTCDGASVSAISIRHNLATSGESRRYDVAFIRFAGRGIWLRQESLRHILASPGYAPGTIAVNVTRLERGFNASKTPHRVINYMTQIFKDRHKSNVNASYTLKLGKELQTFLRELIGINIIQTVFFRIK